MTSFGKEYIADRQFVDSACLPLFRLTKQDLLIRKPGGPKFELVPQRGGTRARGSKVGD
jgi:hypothetical protein